MFHYHVSSVGHKDSKVGEVTARAGGMSLICP